MKIRFTGGLATASVPAATRIEKPSVDCDIDDYDHTRERKLDLAGKTRRIDDCQQIVLEKAVRVARFAGPVPQGVLQIREWANATCKFDEEAPRGCRKVDYENPPPPGGECCAKKSEQNERNVGNQNAVRGQLEEHHRSRAVKKA